MVLNISYSTNTWGLTEISGCGYQINEPCMDIHINAKNKGTQGFHEDNENGHTLRIFKKHPEGHRIFHITKTESCDTCISIVLLTPGEECKTFENALKSIKRPQTCDRNLCVPPNHADHFDCSVTVAHQALDAIVQVSTEFFGAQKDKWLDEAKKFLDEGPQPSKAARQLDPQLEANICTTLGDQEGAMTLLNDLKAKPFNYGIETILKRLLSGVYGDYSSDFLCPQTKLIEDLKRRQLSDLATHVYKDRYAHNGPNSEENLAKVQAFVLNALENNPSS